MEAVKSLGALNDKSILVPLCGATKDMLWLANLGANVYGVEISPIAICGFFDDNKLEYKESTCNSRSIFSSTDKNKKITIMQVDFLQKNKDWLNKFDLIYDNSAFITVKKFRREFYAKLLHLYLKSHGMVILNVNTFNLKKFGMINSVTGDDVKKHFSNKFELVHLRDRRLEVKESHRQQGVIFAIEKTYLLHKSLA